MRSPREAAYQALLALHQTNTFIIDTLTAWKQSESPSQRDFHLAHEIAAGTCRRMLTLDAAARQLTSTGKLKLKSKEKILLRTALYQFLFLDKIPLHALVSESVKIGKKYCHPRFCRFLNASLRQLERVDLAVPSTLHEKYSYPEYFVQSLIDDYGISTAETVLEVGNTLFPATYRKRPGTDMVSTTNVRHLADSADIYIQNSTPVGLISFLAQNSTHSECDSLNILDLCASPGGKSVLMHDLFPQAKLWANDVSQQKMLPLKENFSKYAIDVTLSCGLGQLFQADEKFDIIILDVPCSNTGVLNKRPEARWRLSEENTQQLAHTQQALIQHAATLLKEGGELWYLTCSILKKENEGMIKKAVEDFNLEATGAKTVLPDETGRDGGFCCHLRTKKRDP